MTFTETGYINNTISISIIKIRISNTNTRRMTFFTIKRVDQRTYNDITYYTLGKSYSYTFRNGRIRHNVEHCWRRSPVPYHTYVKVNICTSNTEERSITINWRYNHMHIQYRTESNGQCYEPRFEFVVVSQLAIFEIHIGIIHCFYNNRCNSDRVLGLSNDHCLHHSREKSK